MTWLPYRELEGIVVKWQVRKAAKPVTAVLDLTSTSVSMTPLDNFKETLGQFLRHVGANTIKWF